MHTNEPNGTSSPTRRARYLQMLRETLDELGDYWRHSRLCDEPEVAEFLLLLEDVYAELSDYYDFLEALSELGEE